jgi:O-antigen ligase
MPTRLECSRGSVLGFSRGLGRLCYACEENILPATDPYQRGTVSLSLFKPSPRPRAIHPAKAVSAANPRPPGPAAQRAASPRNAGSTLDTGPSGTWSLRGVEEPRSAGFTILLLQLFIVYSRITDLIGIYLGISSSLVLVFSVLALIAVFASGGIKPALTSTPGLLMTALTFWLIVSTPFSIWKGGSVEVLKDFWIKTYLYFIIVAGLLTTVNQCRKAIYTIALSTMFVSATALVLHGQSDRLDMSGGLLGNPNYLAFFLILAVPCAVLMMSDPRKLYRLAGALGAATFIILAVRTGSRGGLLMLAAALPAFWIRVSAIKKIGLILACVALACVALLVSSGGTIARYRTMFSDTSANEVDPNDEVGMAEGSSIARRALMQEALHYTWQHPILGVGPGQFSTATGTDAHKQLAVWHETHNTYLELSSEAGIPAALLYIGLIVYSTRTSLRIFRRYKRDPAMSEVQSMAYVLFVSNIAFIVGAIFISVAYMFPYIVIVAIVAGLDRGVAKLAGEKSTGTEVHSFDSVMATP